MDGWIRFWTAVWVGWIALSGRAIDLVLCTTPTKPTAPQQKPKSEAEQAAGSAEERAEEAGEGAEKTPPEKTEKRKTTPTKGSPALRILCLVLAIGFIYGLPWTTRIAIAAAAAWTTTAITLGLIATRPKAKPSEKDESSEQKKPDEPPQHPSELLPREHVAVLLSTLYTEGSGVHLATLAEHLTATPLMGLPATPWRTAHVRALLTRHGVRVRPGVRVPPAGTREGVHREDFPPLPPPPAGPPVVGVVVAGQSNNNNAGHSPDRPFRITPDPTNPVRHHVHHERA
ncbi:hypothetical protein I6J39_16850 [Streptomyces californicus]|uniref:Uncharacterized protein n=1 Tax=Streptomyces californicus TaxID=67351 RepID=A0ABX7J2B1_9ACTN|nr:MULTISPECIES: hypothetical protein [Streptomyces]QRV28792.1 hypothetical protein I6J39_16850 [Streptomyces californicus]QRV42206.1 hypothetical protein I6J41_16765 [Streptomyces californicus]